MKEDYSDRDVQPFLLTIENNIKTQVLLFFCQVMGQSKEWSIGPAMNEYRFIVLWLTMKDTEGYVCQTEIHLMLSYIAVCVVLGN